MIMYPLMLGMPAFAGCYAYLRRLNGVPPFSPVAFWGATAAVAIFLVFWWFAILVILGVVTAVAWAIGELLARRSLRHSTAT